MNTTTTAQTDSARKFRELLLYVAHKTANDPKCGAIKLNKLLWFAESEAFMRLGKPISGAVYQKLTEGPAPRALKPARQELIDAGDARLDDQNYYDGRQQRLVALREPDFPMFSAAEIAIVDEVIDKYRGLSAKAISSLSHKEWGWISAKQSTEVRWETYFVLPRPTAEGELVARDLARLASGGDAAK
jgi:uncharacterized phage-associated protein